MMLFPNLETGVRMMARSKIARLPIGNVEVSPSAEVVNHWSARIGTVYDDTVVVSFFEMVFATGQMLLECKAEVNHGQFTEVVQRQKFSQATANRMMVIARNRLLSDPRHIASLPLSIETVAQLAKLPDKKLEAGLRSGEINPKMRRTDVPAPKSSRGRKASAKTARIVPQPEPEPPPEPVIEAPVMVRPPACGTWVTGPNGRPQWPTKGLEPVIPPEKGMVPIWVVPDHEHDQHAMLGFHLVHAIKISQEIPPEDAAAYFPPYENLLTDEVVKFFDWIDRFLARFENQFGPIGNEGAVKAQKDNRP